MNVFVRKSTVFCKIFAIREELLHKNEKKKKNLSVESDHPIEHTYAFDFYGCISNKLHVHFHCFRSSAKEY